MAYLEEIEHPKREWIRGEEIMLTPAGTGHNIVGMNLARIISSYLHGKRCKVFYETKVVFDEENKFIPDLVVVCDRSKIKENAIYGAPDLVIEILSFSTRKRDIGVKKEAYGTFGVREYWIVNPRDKSIEVYHLRDGSLELDDVYAVPQKWEEETMTDKEREEVSLHLKVSLYDDLVVDVREVFEE